MPGEETLQVIVYDEALIEAIGKIEGARRVSPLVSKAKGEADVLAKLLKDKDVKDFMKNIPTLPRAYRLLATQIPGMRTGLYGVYRGKMLAGADPAIAVAVISIYVVQQIKQMWETIKQERISYENMLQAGLDLNYSELKRLTDLQTGYATWWDQFMTAVETEGFINAVRDIVNGVLPALLQGEVMPPSSGAAPPMGRWNVLERLWERLSSMGGTIPGGDIIKGESVPVE